MQRHASPWTEWVLCALQSSLALVCPKSSTRAPSELKNRSWTSAPRIGCKKVRKVLNLAEAHGWNCHLPNFFGFHIFPQDSVQMYSSQIIALILWSPSEFTCSVHKTPSHQPYFKPESIPGILPWLQACSSSSRGWRQLTRLGHI